VTKVIEHLRDDALHGAQEFKKFAIRGNIIDLAVGVVIGTAFGKIVSSLVADIIMPPLGLLVGGMKFTHMKIVLQPGMENGPAVTINYGTFIQTCTDFAIIALAIFLFVKAIARFNRSAAPAPPAAQEVLLSEIRDLLKSIAHHNAAPSRAATAEGAAAPGASSSSGQPP